MWLNFEASRKFFKPLFEKLFQSFVQKAFSIFELWTWIIFRKSFTARKIEELVWRREKTVSFFSTKTGNGSLMNNGSMLLLYSWFCCYRDYLEKNGRNKQSKRRSHQIEITRTTLCTGQCHFVKLSSYVYRKRSINDPKNVWKLLCRDISPPASLAIFPNTFRKCGWLNLKMIRFNQEKTFKFILTDWMWWMIRNLKVYFLLQWDKKS